MDNPESPKIIHLYFRLAPVPKLNEKGGTVIEYRAAPRDPYDLRTEERIKAGERPPEQPPVELAQNE